MSYFKGIIFDMDGTLTLPLIDFRKVRQDIGITETGDLVSVIEKWSDDDKKRAWDIIERHEAEAVKSLSFQPGADRLLRDLKEKNFFLGIITRNSKKSADEVVRKLGVGFDTVLTREFPFIKPDPAPVRHILEIWGIEPEEALLVGDYIHDIECAKAAGAVSCFFRNPGAVDFSYAADYSVESFSQLEELVFNGP